MKLHEKNLKKIIKVIEKYGAVKDVRILNNSIIICPVSHQSNPEPSKVIEIDLNKAKEFEIKFILGDVKGKIGKDEKE